MYFYKADALNYIEKDQKHSGVIDLTSNPILYIYILIDFTPCLYASLIADCTKPLAKPTSSMCDIHLSAIYQKTLFASHNNMCLKINF